jgi:hypothetical protein
MYCLYIGSFKSLALFQKVPKKDTQYDGIKLPHKRSVVIGWNIFLVHSMCRNNTAFNGILLFDNAFLTQKHDNTQACPRFVEETR